MVPNKIVRPNIGFAASWALVVDLFSEAHCEIYVVRRLINVLKGGFQMMVLEYIVQV